MNSTTVRIVRRSRLAIVCACAWIFVAQDWSRAQQSVALPQEDRIRIAEAFRLAGGVGDEVWPGWSKAPFALMLITDDRDFLLRHPHATNNFDTLGFDKELDTRVLYRKRLFPTNLLATFPAINDVPTIVVGQAAHTGVTSSTAWVLTIVHEHFHQYQQSQPDYYSSTQALGLSHGDRTGMWMLNYPFPYDSADVDEAYAAMAKALLDAIESGPREQPGHLKFFFSTLERFKLLLPPDDFTYFSFQCWQEGVARYTEWKVAEVASREFKPGAVFQTLADYQPFNLVADSIRSNILNQLANPRLSELRRVAFYSLGAGEAFLLDKVTPGWQRHYLEHKFHLEKDFSK